MKKILKPENFFTLDDFFLKQVFESCKYPWQVLIKLEEFIEQFFKVNQLQSNIYSEKGVKIEQPVKISGKVIIGENSKILAFSKIRGPAIIGRNCLIGHCCELKKSIVLDNSRMAHFNYVGDSIIGNNVNLGAGVKLANLKLNYKEIYVEGIATGLKKFGAAIGDYSKLGCNAVTMPGTLLGKRSLVMPNTTVGPGFLTRKDLLSHS